MPNLKDRYLKHKDFEDEGFKGDHDRGIEILRISSWDNFHKIIQIFNKGIEGSRHRYKYSDFYIWRGQTKDYKLKSSFDRHPFYSRLKNLDESGEIRREILNVLFKKFKEKLIELQEFQKSKNLKYFDEEFIQFDFSDSKNEDQVWAVGQHYGLPTPLLDWSKDPYKAAYFAFCKNNTNEQCDRVVYVLNRKLKELMAHWNKIEGEEKITIKRKKFVEIPNLERTFVNKLNNRLDAQEGLFTKALNGRDIEKNVWNLYRKKTDFEAGKLIILAKIFITDELQMECLDYLKNKKDLTHVKLFPDYNGVVDGCKIDFNLDDLK